MTDIIESGDSWGSDVAEIEVLGHPCLSFVKRRHHIADLLADGRRFTDRNYLVQGSRRMSFAEHEVAVDRITALLDERGVRPGDRVMLFGANSIEWVVAFWAAIRSGAVVVLANAWWSRTEVDHALRTVTPRYVVADDVRAPLLPDTQERIDFADITSTLEGDAAPAITRPTATEDDAAIVLFTSGTTGLPKGAVLSHRGVLATLQSLALLTRRLPGASSKLPAPSTALLSIPLFHVGGLQQIITPMLAGGSLVFTEGRFDPQKVLRLLDEEQVSVWSTVPTLVSRVMDHMEAVGHEGASSVRTVGLGGSPVGAQLRNKVPRWFPNASRGVAVTYGLSEGGGVLATGIGADLVNRPGSVGRPLPVVTIRIENPDENGEGEILVRSPSVMLQYWTAEERSLEPVDDPITPDRWLRTGDIGRLDNDGFLYVTDRRKDIVIRGGENIATPHVENRLLEHPGVREVAVVGLPHPNLGEEVGAIVVLRDDSTVTEEELAAFAREQLAYFEVPTRWRISLKPLPQNATGKVVKRTVRDEWIAEMSSVSTPSPH
ncbi:class I adenylate-forming enzyme family protein [Rhodococcus koreensis]|uniref:class I adenylate-forming enzyme family protein n=1 Tax=Rhodococcus koreensis TaxID=99653 RepID=UPI00366E090D